MLFELRDVHLDRAGKRVLNGVSARLPDGATCLVGPSGSGKSTILRLLNRLADPDRGVVLYRGRDVRELEPRALRREVALVPQLPALLPGTVADNVAYAAGQAGHEPEVERMLTLSGLGPGYAERDAERLSVGERQRVMLARALALRPRVLLLDEPTSALDPDARAAVEATLRDLSRRLGIARVVVTHDEGQARRLAEWIVRVEAGRAIACGPVGEVLASG